MSVVLFEKILSLFLIMMAGYVIVKLGFLKPEDSKCLSTLALYIVVPCTIVTAFQVECTTETQLGLLLAVGAAFVVQMGLVGANALLRKPLGLNPVEQASVVYSNSGNLIIPIVSLLLGSDWVVYTCAYIFVQRVLIWSHGRRLLSTGEKPGIKQILTNINMVATYIGIVVFFLEIEFPFPLQSAMDSIAAMVGPVSMLITGMLIGGMKVKEILSYKRVWLVALLRLIALPGLALLLFKFSGIAELHPQGEYILLITLLATGAPSASNVVQMVQVYGGDAKYAGTISVITTMLCIITLPLMVAIYML